MAVARGAGRKAHPLSRGQHTNSPARLHANHPIHIRFRSTSTTKHQRVHLLSRMPPPEEPTIVAGEVLARHYVDGWSASRISGDLGRSRSAVSPILCDAERLRAHSGADGTHTQAQSPTDGAHAEAEPPTARAHAEIGRAHAET